MLRSLILVPLSLLLSPFLSAQETSASLFPERIDIDLSAGVNVITFRDLATSPLFYEGPVPTVSGSYLNRGERIEETFTIDFSYGNTFAYVNGDAVSVSLMQTSQLYYSRLYKLRKLSSEVWNTKVGGMVNGRYNIRQNPELRNNQIGFEAFFTLFGSGKLSRDLSRKKRKTTEFWFIKYSLPPRLRTLSYQLDLALINSTYRNDYIYTNQSSVVNSDNYFDDYVFTLISGYRLRSTLQYMIYLKNANAFMFSYEWDALKTGGDLDKYEMTNHMLKFTLIYNLR